MNFLFNGVNKYSYHKYQNQPIDYETENNEKGFCDDQGRLIGTPTTYSKEHLYGDYYAYSITSDYTKVGLMKIDGTVLTDAFYDKIRNTDSPDYFLGMNGDDVTIIRSDGSIVATKISYDYSNNSLIFERLDGSSYK